MERPQAHARERKPVFVEAACARDGRRGRAVWRAPLWPIERSRRRARGGGADLARLRRAQGLALRIGVLVGLRGGAWPRQRCSRPTSLQGRRPQEPGHDQDAEGQGPLRRRARAHHSPTSRRRQCRRLRRAAERRLRHREQRGLPARARRAARRAARATVPARAARASAPSPPASRRGARSRRASARRSSATARSCGRARRGAAPPRPARAGRRRARPRPPRTARALPVVPPAPRCARAAAPRVLRCAPRLATTRASQGRAGRSASGGRRSAASQVSCSRSGGRPS